MAKKPAQPQDKYVLRLPDGMRDRLKLAADSRHRSMNAEIIARLEGSFRGWPKITLSEELFDRVKNAGFDQRKAMEKEIETFTVKVVERELPASHELRRNFMEAFYRLLRPVHGEVSTELQERFRALAEDVEKAARQAESSE